MSGELSAETRSSLSAPGSSSSPLVRWATALVISLLAFIVVIAVFSPRYVVWKGMGAVTPIGRQADVARGETSLRQLQSPWDAELPPPDVIVRWRLVFPLLGHYTGMSPRVYLALPWLGVLLTLAYFCQLSLKAGWSSWETLAGAIVFGASAWLFTSTAWLSYADAWLILGALLVVWAEARPAQIMALVFTPWVDERFLFAAIIAFGLRWALSRSDESLRLTRRQWLENFGLLVAFVVLRGALVFAPVSKTLDYTDQVARRPTVPLMLWLRGTWGGVRLGWVFIVAFVWLFACNVPAKVRYGVLAAVFIPLLIVVPIAGDLTRSAAMIAPAAVAGMLLLRQQSVKLFRGTLIVSVVLALVIPAEHVVTSFQIPIKTAWTEVGMLRALPAEFKPDRYVDAGIQAMAKKDAEEAKINFDTAIVLDSRHPRARLSRASWYLSQGDARAALADVEMALESSPKTPEAMLILGTARQRVGDAPGAETALTEALKIGGPTWPSRASAQRRLDQIRGVTTKPATQP